MLLLDWKTLTMHTDTIDVGTTVRWTWGDAFPHTVTSQTGPESFDSGNITGSGMFFEYTFDVAGEYTYCCGVHQCASMSGTLTVQAN